MADGITKPFSKRRGAGDRAGGLFLGPAMIGAMAGWSCILLGAGAIGAAAVASWALPSVILGAGLLSAAGGFLVWRVAALTRELAASAQDRERLAVSDTLTGTLNHSAFMDLLEREYARCHRYGQPLALLLLDIDFFKRINAAYGHATGDEVLKAFVATLGHGLRNVDAVGRVGGKDFAVMLPNTGCEAAVTLAERLREKVAAVVVRASADEEIRVTASIGVGCLGAEDASLRPFLGRAERALRAAKSGGRNRVELCSADVVPVVPDESTNGTSAGGAGGDAPSLPAQGESRPRL